MNETLLGDFTPENDLQECIVERAYEVIQDSIQDSRLMVVALHCLLWDQHCMAGTLPSALCGHLLRAVIEYRVSAGITQPHQNMV